MSNLLFDVILAAALLWSAWSTLTSPEPVRAVVMFIVFGLLMTLAWARLDAPDIALAEAAIGAGLTGALLLDALRRQPGAQTAPPSGPASRRWVRTFRVLALLGCAGALAVALLLAVLDAPAPVVRLAPLVAANLEHSGVSHPVTAVLLNFRAYDTLLEVAVLLAALIGMLALASPAPAGRAEMTAEPLLQTMARALAPLMILVAGYLLWAGAHRPGGAFQAGAVVAASLVLLHLAGLLPALWQPSRLLRLAITAGFALFLGIAALLLTQGEMLRFPPPLAGALILLIEAGLTVSLGLLLASLFLLLAARRGRS